MRPRRHEQNQTSFRPCRSDPRCPQGATHRRPLWRSGPQPRVRGDALGARSSRSTGSTVTCRRCSTRSLPRTARHDCSAGSSSNWSERVDGQIQQVGSDVANLGENVTVFAGDINRLDGHIVRLNGHIQDDLWPLMARAESLNSLNETVAWLVQRVETVRAEMMHELRYGQPRESDEIDVEIVNPAAAESRRCPALEPRLRPHPARRIRQRRHARSSRASMWSRRSTPCRSSPRRSTRSSARTCSSTFRRRRCERRLLPYWCSLLAPGGVFRAVVPDVDAMIDSTARRRSRSRTSARSSYGGQEYEGDFHHTAFTPDSLSELLVEGRVRSTSNSSNGVARTVTVSSSSSLLADRRDAGLRRHLHVQPGGRTADDARVSATAAVPRLRGGRRQRPVDRPHRRRARSSTGDASESSTTRAANLSMSRNLGIRAAAGEHRGVHRRRRAARAGWLEQAIAAFDDPEVAGVGGIVLDHTGMSSQYRYSARRPVRRSRRSRWTSRSTDLCVPGRCHVPVPAGHERAVPARGAGRDRPVRRDVRLLPRRDRRVLPPRRRRLSSCASSTAPRCTTSTCRRRAATRPGS